MEYKGEQMEEWDPLAIGEIDEVVASDAQKRQIENLLQSYTGYFDVFSELIQNALDAVDKRAEISDSTYEPTIWIEIDLVNNSVKVIDNGIGFKKDEFHSFLTPNISFKTTGKTRGNKGVGATYLAYGFNHLEMGTKIPEFSSYALITNGRTWVKSPYGTERPKVKEMKIPEDFTAKVDRGSVFYVKLVGDNIRPKDLSWIQATKAEQWEAVLRIKTPLGGLYLNGESTKTKCHLTVKDKSGNITQRLVEKCEYLYPHTVIPSTAKLSEIQDAQQKAAKDAKDQWKDIPGSFRSLWGVYEIWDANTILSKETLKPQLTESERKLLNEIDPVTYGFFGYSVDIWDYVNDQKYLLRPGHRILNGGLQMATSNMPQGNLITIPLTKSIGYQKTSHAIIQLKNAPPDYGRKGFQPDVEELAKKLSVSVVNYLKKWYPLLKKETGATLDISASRALHDWIKDQEKFAESHPLVINNENFFLPTKKISILSIPQKEQDVIVLFNQLIAGGVIRGIKIMSTNPTSQYDSLCRIAVTAPMEHQEYNEITNPLGIKDPLAKSGESEPWVLEYKVNLDALLSEFEKEEKQEKDVNLVVCWEAGKKWKENYSITPLLYNEHIHLRPFHGVTHEVKGALSGNRVFYLIVLSELIQYLNNQNKAQQDQKQTYINS